MAHHLRQRQSGLPSTTLATKRVHFKRIFAEGNYVILHSTRSGRATGTGTGREWIFSGWNDQGKIVEHWDVLQIVPETSANDNAMF